MKNTRYLFTLAVLILLGVCMTTSCKNKASDNQQTEATTDTLPMMEQDHDDYLIDDAERRGANTHKI